MDGYVSLFAPRERFETNGRIPRLASKRRTGTWGTRTSTELRAGKVLNRRDAEEFHKWTLRKAFNRKDRKEKPQRARRKTKKVSSFKVSSLSWAFRASLRDWRTRAWGTKLRSCAPPGRRGRLPPRGSCYCHPAAGACPHAVRGTGNPATSVCPHVVRGTASGCRLFLPRGSWYGHPAAGGCPTGFRGIPT